MVADAHVSDGVVCAICGEGEIVFVAIPPVVSCDTGNIGAGFGKLPATAFADIFTVCCAVEKPSAGLAGGSGAAF